MQKTLILITALLISCPSRAEQVRPMNYQESNLIETVTKPIAPLSDAITHEIADYLQKNITFMGKSIQPDARTRDKQTLRVTRSLKDCIKPGGLIDDEVQMCVNGTREKYWPSPVDLQNAPSSLLSHETTHHPSTTAYQAPSGPRPLKDCIKPGGLIDDDVQMCVNGTRSKDW